MSDGLIFTTTCPSAHVAALGSHAPGSPGARGPNPRPAITGPSYSYGVQRVRFRAINETLFPCFASLLPGFSTYLSLPAHPWFSTVSLIRWDASLSRVSALCSIPLVAGSFSDAIITAHVGPVTTRGNALPTVNTYVFRLSLRHGSIFQ